MKKNAVRTARALLVSTVASNALHFMLLKQKQQNATETEVSLLGITIFGPFFVDFFIYFTSIVYYSITHATLLYAY